MFLTRGVVWKLLIVIIGNKIELAGDRAEQFDQAPRIFHSIIQPGNQDIFKSYPASRDTSITFSDIQQFFYGIFAVDRDNFIPLFIGRGIEGNRQFKALVFSGKALDARNDTTGRNCNMTCGKFRPKLAIENPGGAMTFS